MNMTLRLKNGYFTGSLAVANCAALVTRSLTLFVAGAIALVVGAVWTGLRWIVTRRFGN